MTKLLVVDDSRMDQRLVREVLKSRPNLQIACAGNGREALEIIEANAADLVLTDLRMPKMDGLELVSEIRRRKIGVPVVLMTSHGSEEIAAAALRRGAASYVPKRFLLRDLVLIVDRMLALIEARNARRSADEALVEVDSHFALTNDEEQIHPLIYSLQQDLVRVRLCDETTMLHMEVALQEALCNAIQHGNLEVSSELRNEGDDAFQQLLDERRRTPPYCDRRVHVTAAVSPEQATYVVRDEGPGFDPAVLPDPRDPANLARPFGRGLMLIQTFMDETRHNAAGNEITMVKKREGAQRRASPE